MSRSPRFLKKPQAMKKNMQKLWFKELGGIGDTAANLKSAAEGEHEEWTKCTRKWPKPPKKRDSIVWHSCSSPWLLLKREHEERYLKLLGNIEDNLVFQAGEGNRLDLPQLRPHQRG